MFGYYITYGAKSSHQLVCEENGGGYNQATFDGWTVCRYTLPKFQNHKFFLDEASFFFSTDGVILNIDELFAQYQCTDIAELISILYRLYGETFYRLFRGSFSGLFYDKEQKIMLVFVDQTASRLLFWGQTNESVLISSDMCWMASQRKQALWDNHGMYELLTYGYMPSHHTILQDVHRLPAGCFLRISAGACQQVQYHRFSNTPLRRSKKQEVEGTDRLFRQAVQRVLKVNEAYGYRNIFPLSAGLDSRMTTWVAHDLAETPIENFTHGLSDSMDAEVARSIAGTLGHKWYFIDHKGGDFLSDIDESVCKSGLQICYSGIAESTDVFRIIPMEQTGIILTGIGGDDILTSPLDRSWRQYRYGECALSTVRYPEQKQFIPDEFYTRYDTRNIFYLYARTFECHAQGSPLAFQQYAESYSPFMDVDFLEFVLSIPERHRITYRLYDRWIFSCYPEAAQWKHNGKTIGNRAPELFICHRHIPIGTISKRIFTSALRRLHIHDFSEHESYDEYTPQTAKRLEQYYEQNKHYLTGCGMVAERIDQQFRSKKVQEKMQALTVLAAVKAVCQSRAC